VKTRITAVILSLALIFALSGCQTERNDTTKVKENADSSFSESSKHSEASDSEDSSQALEESSQLSAESLPSQSDVEENDTEITASAASEPESSKQSSSPAVEKPIQTAEPTKPPIKVEQPQESPSPEPTPIEPPTVSQPEPPTPEPEPEFDISYWISFAQSYAESNGLVLNSEAVECWDNPIGAGAHCKYLERDIKSRLNRYAKDEDVTDVWIWAVSTGSETYDIFIGYA
jgi:hypothetical protein